MEHDAREQTHETNPDLTPKSRPGAFSLLLSLPLEIHLEIIELLEENWEEREPNVVHPLVCLRATCKLFDELSRPTLFRSIRMISPAPRKPEMFKELAPKLAGYLRNIAFVISINNYERDLVYHMLLQNAPNLRRLSVWLSRGDVEPHTQILDALAHIRTLEDVIIGDVNYGEHSPLLEYDLVPSTFNHRFLNHILDHHAQRLRTLILSSTNPIHESTFRRLRETTPQLRRFECTRAITIDTRAAFTEPQRWACADRLEHLYFRRCGIHAATIARHLAMGVFGKLRSLHMVMCGDGSDDSTEPVGTAWSIPPLERVEVEHFTNWEMDKLRTIHTKKVYVARDWTGRSQCVDAFGKDTTFPGAVELHVATAWEDERFEELRRSCAKRGLIKVERDHAPMASCLCHPD